MWWYESFSHLNEIKHIHRVREREKNSHETCWRTKWKIRNRRTVHCMCMCENVLGVNVGACDCYSSKQKFDCMNIAAALKCEWKKNTKWKCGETISSVCNTFAVWMAKVQWTHTLVHSSLHWTLRFRPNCRFEYSCGIKKVLKCSKKVSFG